MSYDKIILNNMNKRAN